MLTKSLMMKNVDVGPSQYNTAHAHAHAQAHAQVHTYMHAAGHVHAYAHVAQHVHALKANAYARMHTQLHVRTCMPICLYQQAPMCSQDTTTCYNARANACRHSYPLSDAQPKASEAKARCAEGECHTVDIYQCN